MPQRKSRARTHAMLRWLWSASLALIAAGCTLNAAPQSDSLTISGEPVVRIVSPLPNAAYLEGVPVNIQAQISNAGADIDRVEIAADNTLIATLPQPNTSSAAAFNVVYTWTAAGEGDHLLSVSAFRADGSSSAPATVSISVRPQNAAEPTATQTTGATGAVTSGTQPTVQPSRAPATATSRPPTNTAPPATQAGAQTQPTNTQAAPAGGGAPTASFVQGINVRRGPGTNFDPPIGAFAAGQTTQILALNLDGQWYKVRYGGSEGWVYAPLTTVTGDVSSLPREAGPPTPFPPTATTAPPTAIPPTAAPASNVNLVAGIVVLEPNQPRCAETFVVGLDVANLGTQPSGVSGTVSLRDVRAADGSTQGETIGGYPVLQPGETFRVNMPITISTWYNEDHRIILTIDPQNQIPETENGDNVREITYRLDKGNCP